MKDHRQEISWTINKLTSLAKIDPGIASDLEPIMYPGMPRYDIGILNAVVIRAKQLCPSNDAIQALDPLEWECWYSQYRALARRLIRLLTEELEKN